MYLTTIIGEARLARVAQFQLSGVEFLPGFFMDDAPSNELYIKRIGHITVTAWRLSLSIYACALALQVPIFQLSTYRYAQLTPKTKRE